MDSMNTVLSDAVEFLSKELSPDLIAKLQLLNIDRIDQHFGIGVTVRNILRRSDMLFDDVWLDNHWFDILKEAIEYGQE